MLAANDGKVKSVTTSSRPLLQAVPHLSKLACLPITIHVSLQPTIDHTIITALQHTGFTILMSDSLVEAQDMAIAAHAIALESLRGVIHFFTPESADQATFVGREEDEVMSKLITKSRKKVARLVQRTSQSLYWGTASSIVRPEAPKVEDDKKPTNGLNGHANGHANGDNGNGYASSPSSGSDEAVEVNDDIPDIWQVIPKVFETLSQVLGRVYKPVEYFGPTDADHVLFVFGSHQEEYASLAATSPTKLGLLKVRVYRPWPADLVVGALPKSTTRIAVLEQMSSKTSRWGPLYIDVLTALNAKRDAFLTAVTVIGHTTGYGSVDGSIKDVFAKVDDNMNSDKPAQGLYINTSDRRAEDEVIVEIPPVEAPYTKMLEQLFGESLWIINSPTAGPTAELAVSPEFSLGRYLEWSRKRGLFLEKLHAATTNPSAFTSPEISPLLSKLLLSLQSDSVASNSQVHEIWSQVSALLKHESQPLAKEILGSNEFLSHCSPWIIGSDAWSYDIGDSGVHHFITSGENVNMLIIDSQPHTSEAEANAAKRKKDIGLYAMNFGNVYVASVALYSSYTQVMHALVEAAKFEGPSVVLAYLPFFEQTDSPVTMLQETKKAVDSGYWPLYRWNPALEATNEEIFQLDSERVKQQLKDFLSRENHLTHLVLKRPELAKTLTESYGSAVKHRRLVQAKRAYDKLMDGLSGPPLTILFASDGGNAESLAKRLQRRGKARGLKAKVMAMDDMPAEDLPGEGNVAFITAVAGQGEFPQNGRELWENVKNSTDLNVSKLHFAVFGLGDSHYWPRKEDKIYYNKPCKDLDTKLEVLGAHRLVDVGLGNDQDPDAYETAYALWEPELWKSLGVDKVDADIDEPAPLTNEDIKVASRLLRGTIEEGLADDSTGAIAPDDAQLTKFHGTYQQDDRDLRDERRAQGLEPAYAFMVRVRMPGGVCKPNQVNYTLTNANTNI